MKKYSVLFLLFALGCHNAGPNVIQVESQQGEPASVMSDITLGCQNTVSDPSQAVGLNDMIDGKAGTYKLTSSTAYFESQPFTGKNSAFVLQSNNITGSNPDLQADQAISCADLTKLGNNHLDSEFVIPFEISRTDGKILSAAQFTTQIDKDSNSSGDVSTIADASTIAGVDPKFPDLKSLMAAKKSRHSKTVRLGRVSPNEIHILFTDKFITPKKNKGIKAILGIYQLSGT